MKKIAAITLTLAGLTLLAGSAHAQQWGTIQGQVTWGGAKAPVRNLLKVDKDIENCTRNGKLLEETWLVDPKTNGIKNALVWLAPATPDGKVDHKGKLEIHKTLQPIKEKTVVMDQPCCMFVPQVIGLREGQTLTVKNSDKVTHNTNIQGLADNPNVNFLLPAGTEKEVPNWRAAKSNVVVSCNLHPWMRSNVRVFNHPYFVVTGDDGKFEIKDAPAGTYRLLVWHPGNQGAWLVGAKEPNSDGIEIKINGGKTTEVSGIKVMPAAPPAEEKK